MRIHPSITPKAAKLLQRVAKRILKYHEEYDQHYYIPTCGSGCCIAGHIWLMQNKNQTTSASEACGFAIDQIGYPSNIFSLPLDWRPPFCDDYFDSETSLERARVGYRRIMHYLRTGE